MEFWKVILTLIWVQCASGQNKAIGDKVSELLKRKFSTYDKAVRPNMGDKPVTITVSGYVLDIFDISEKNQEFTVNMYLRHEWKDPRLEFTETDAGTDKIILNTENAQKIWKVDTFIVNERESKGHGLISDNEFTRISADGTVLISNRFTIKAACKMDLGWFPFDRHTCPLVLESYSYGTNDISYQWKGDSEGSEPTNKAVGVSEDTSSIQFKIAGVKSRKEVLQVGSNFYSKLAVEFFVIRASTRYVHEVFIPAMLLTCLSFITLLHATGTSKARLQISIIVEGILIILMSLSAKTMPDVSYQTSVDFYLMICLFTITAVVMVNVAVCLILNSANDSNGIVRLRSINETNSVEEDGKEVLFDTNTRLPIRTNRFFTIFIKLRLCIPLVFVVFNILYWIVVCIGSSHFPSDFLILEKNIVN